MKELIPPKKDLRICKQCFAEYAIKGNHWLCPNAVGVNKMKKIPYEIKKLIKELCQFCKNYNKKAIIIK